MSKKKIMWGFISLLIAGLTIWAVSKQSKAFTLEMYIEFVKKADFRWIMCGMLCMIAYIWCEGHALSRLAKSLGFPRKNSQKMLYAAADIYFSAITPSASGGQPASAYFMIIDGMTASATTVCLMINLIMYILALLLVGGVCVLFKFDLYMQLSTASHVLISIGLVVLVGLSVLFYLLIKKADILRATCNKFMTFLEKIHLLHHVQRKREKLNKIIEDYRKCAEVIIGRKKVLIEVFAWNLVQRFLQIGITIVVFLAVGKSFATAMEAGYVQCLAYVGSNSIPIPGAMGIADYIMLDGFANVAGECESTYMELLCRGISFYGCVLTSMLIVLVGYFVRKGKKEKGN